MTTSTRPASARASATSWPPHARAGGPDAVEQSVLWHAEMKTHNVWTDGLDGRARGLVKRRAAVRRHELGVRRRRRAGLLVVRCEFLHPALLPRLCRRRGVVRGEEFQMQRRALRSVFPKILLFRRDVVCADGAALIAMLNDGPLRFQEEPLLKGPCVDSMEMVRSVAARSCSKNREIPCWRPGWRSQCAE